MSTSSLRRVIAAAGIGIVTAVLPGSTGSAAGTGLDPRFGSAGRTLVDGVSADAAVDIALQADGGIIGVSTVTTAAKGTDGVVFRLRPDGQPDTAFGVVHLDVQGGNESAWSVALQPDGKIVVAGSTSNNSDAAVWRLLPSGAVDGSFGMQGLATLDNNGAETALDVAAYPFNRLVVVGSTTTYGSSDWAVWRLKDDGQPDRTWSGTGTRITVSPGFDTLRRVLVRPDGRILVAGVAAGQPIDVWGYDVLGNPDTAFNPQGHVAVPGTLPAGTDMALRDDGSVVVAGQDATSPDVRVVHLDGAGVDASFGGPSGARLDLGGGEIVNTVVPLADGRVLVSGRTSTSGGRPFVALLGRDGSLDPVFGAGGVAYPTGLESVSAMAVQPDRLVVVAGPVSDITDDALVLRYLDPTTAHADGTGGGAGSGAGTTASCAGRPATIVGTPGKDRLRGSAHDDVIVALGGNDVVRASSGNDLVCGGNGNDRVAGGAGRDRLYGEAGRDRLVGGSGKDRVVGGPGRDRARDRGAGDG